MINYDKLKQEYQNISQELSLPETFKDQKKYSQLAKRFSHLEKTLKLIVEREGYLKEKEHLLAMVSTSSEDKEMKALIEEELTKLSQKIEKLGADIEDRILAEDSLERDVIIEIRAAAGGDESALFAAVLYKMYCKYAERKGFKQETLSSSPTEIGGFKEVVFSLRGEGVYSHFKFESGVHRVQRVPATEASGRIHTSTVTVAVLVEPEELDLKINPEDLKIDTFRSSGAGGQHVNVTDSAVRITHIPSGTIVSCQDERSQIKNRAKAMRVLKARIMESRQSKEVEKTSSLRRIQIGSGERSEKIRTYNFPERRVTDHRINFSLYRLEEILDGDLEEIVKKLIREERLKIYEAKGLI